MKETLMVTREEYLRGVNLLSSFKPRDLQRKRIIIAAAEWAALLLFVALWLWPFGYEHLIALARSIGDAHMPTAQGSACFVFFVLALRFGWEMFRRIAKEVSNHNKARTALRDMSLWVQIFAIPAIGFRINLITQIDSGQNMSLELYGVNKQGQPIMLTINSPGYSRNYVQQSFTERPAILKRMMETHPRINRVLAEHLLSMPASTLEISHDH